MLFQGHKLFKVSLFIALIAVLSGHKQIDSKPYLLVLGTIQDGGLPHLNCKKNCCSNLLNKGKIGGLVSSLGLIDPLAEQSYVFDASPDFTQQIALLQKHQKDLPAGIFLTHAHIGHYTGLMYLGKEALNANQIPVYAMPRLDSFLHNNGPWSLLIENKNIQIKPLANQEHVVLNKSLKVIPFLVPHRDEYSETVGFKIIGPNKTALFIPDIDKWEKWDKNIVEEIKQVDYAFIDATFFGAAEINNRDISQIPHPFVSESMELFQDFSLSEKKKIRFIHLNHSNPLLDSSSTAYKDFKTAGFHLAVQNEVYEL